MCFALSITVARRATVHYAINPENQQLFCRYWKENVEISPFSGHVMGHHDLHSCCFFLKSWSGVTLGRDWPGLGWEIRGTSTETIAVLPWYLTEIPISITWIHASFIVTRTPNCHENPGNERTLGFVIGPNVYLESPNDAPVAPRTLRSLETHKQKETEQLLVIGSSWAKRYSQVVLPFGYSVPVLSLGPTIYSHRS